MRQARGALQERLQELVANEDYEEAAKVQEQMRVLAMPQAEFAQGDHKDPTTFEFCMEDLYRELFQAEESHLRECRLHALYSSLAAYALRTQGSFLRQECGRLKADQPSTGTGTFDLRTRQVLWKYAAMAWRDGWPRARASAEIAESEDEEEPPKIAALPQTAVQD